jgi:pimeloyl-ACP methyl ester carboxylesterase
LAAAMKLSEQAVLIGKQKSIVGVVTQAIEPDGIANDLGVIILNTGIIHRVGHHRMYVTFARCLAGAGYPVLRFDFSGIGDSDSRADGLPPLDSILAEIREALDWFAVPTRVNRVVLLGLCSGADYAVTYAAADPRVVGLVLMDPSIPPTPRHLRSYITRRLLRLKSWFNVAFGPSFVRRTLIDFLISSVAPNREPKYPTLSNRKIRAQLERVYQISVNRGVKFLTIFTGSGRQSYPEQLIDAFPNVQFSDQLRLESFGGSDHTFTSETARRRLLKLILEWLTETGFLKATVVLSASLSVKVLNQIT